MLRSFAARPKNCPALRENEIPDIIPNILSKSQNRPAMENYLANARANRKNLGLWGYAFIRALCGLRRLRLAFKG